MPIIFEFRCKEHGPMDCWLEGQRFQTMPCPYCDVPMPRLLSTFALNREFFSNTHIPNLGTFNSRGSMEAEIKRRGLVHYESGIEKNTADNRAHRLNQNASKLNKAVEKIAGEFPSKISESQLFGREKITQ